MKSLFLAAAAVLFLTGAANAQSPGAGGPATPGKRCDRDGCWTYNCDTTSNHCHRHWTSSAPRGIPAMGASPPANRPDQICDIDGENCRDASPPN
ncbi:MAG: hypothetical protein ACREHE_07645 [Rhizomicrobium sp.]